MVRAPYARNTRSPVLTQRMQVNAPAFVSVGYRPLYRPTPAYAMFGTDLGHVSPYIVPTRCPEHTEGAGRRGGAYLPSPHA
eukprot:785395-Rhodomonas_salina.1